jgi:hypothetical protein
MSSQRRSLTLHLDSCHALLEKLYAGALRAPGSQPSADQTAERSTAWRPRAAGSRQARGRISLILPSFCARGCTCGAYIRVRPVATTRVKRSADSGSVAFEECLARALLVAVKRYRDPTEPGQAPHCQGDQHVGALFARPGCQSLCVSPLLTFLSAAHLPGHEAAARHVFAIGKPGLGGDHSRGWDTWTCASPQSLPSAHAPSASRVARLAPLEPLRESVSSCDSRMVRTMVVAVAVNAA